MPDSDLKVHEDLKADTSHGDHERFAHYVDKNDMMQAAVFGTPIKALCGKVWVPSRDPQRFPVCPECKEIYESLPPGDDRRRRIVVVTALPESAAPVLNPDLPPLRGWQKAAYAEYFRVAKRDFLLVATPGAGKTTYALTVASELLARREIAGGHDRDAHRAPEVPVGAGGDAVRHRHRPVLPERPGPGGGRLPGRRGHLRAGRGAPGAAQGAHGEPQDAGHLRRDPPRGRRAVLGRRRQGGVRPGPAQAGADRDAVPLRRQPDPVRHLRPRGGRVQAVRLRLRLRLRARARRRRGPAGDLPGLLRRDALAHPGGRRDHRHPRHADDQGPDRAGVADRARPGRRLDRPGARGRRQAADRGAPGHARRGRPGDRQRPRDRPRLRGAAAPDQRRAARPWCCPTTRPRARRSPPSPSPTARWMVAVRMVSEGVDVPRLAVGVYATSVSTPLFFAQAVGRFVRARKRGETASVFVPSVPTLLGFAAELEAERDHVVRALDRDPEAELERGPAGTQDARRLRAARAGRSRCSRRRPRSTGCCSTAASSAPRPRRARPRRRTTSGCPACSNPTR